MQQRCVFITEMTFTGRQVSTERAERAGLTNNIVPVDELQAFTIDLAEAIAEKRTACHALMKAQLRILAGAQPNEPTRFRTDPGLAQAGL